MTSTGDAVAAALDQRPVLATAQPEQHMPPKRYGRVLLKLSGEVFGGGAVGLDLDVVSDIARQISDVVRSGERLLVDWRDVSVDAEPWLAFAGADQGLPVTLKLSKVDPDADFSYDYEDLSFIRVRDCP